MKISLVSLGLIIVVVLVLVIRDTTSTPPPPPPASACALNKRIILPDVCNGTCGTQTVECPPATTRPYAIIGTQAATCPDALICLP